MPVIRLFGHQRPTPREVLSIIIDGLPPCPVPVEKLPNFVGPVICDRSIRRTASPHYRRAPTKDRLDGPWWALVNPPRKIFVRGYAIPSGEQAEFLAEGIDDPCACRCVGLTAPTVDGIGLMPQSFFPKGHSVRITRFESAKG
jgi:hypothetical protein